MQPPPPTLHAGEPWRTAVAARGVRPHAVVIAGQSRRLSFRLRRAGARLRATVVFPSAGLWRYGVRVGSKTRFVGRARVLAARPRLRQPFAVLEEAGGTLLVADWPADRIYRLSPSTRDGVVVARIPRPRDLAWTPEGRLLVASGERVVQLDPATGATHVVVEAEAFVGGLAVAPDGTLFVNEDGTTIARIFPDGRRTTLAAGLDGVHGLEWTEAGLVVCESFAGRVLLLRDDGLELLAAGLANPSYAVADEAGLFVTEFAGSRVSRLAWDGSVDTLANVPQPGPITRTRAGDLLVGSLDGSIRRVDPATGAVRRVYP